MELEKETQSSKNKNWRRRLAKWMITPLKDTCITPNQLTTVRFAVGLAAIWCFTFGEQFWNNLGGILFVISVFLDNTDGELASLSKKTSSFGHKYDFVSDAMVNALLFVAIGLGMKNSFKGDFGIEFPTIYQILTYFGTFSTWLIDKWFVILGIIAGISVSFIFLMVAHLEKSGKSPLPPSDGFEADEFMYVVGPIAWLGYLPYFLYAAVIGAPAFALWTLWVVFKSKNKISAK